MLVYINNIQLLML